MMKRSFVGLALLLAAAPLFAETITLLDNGTSLVFVDSATPNVVINTVAIAGLQVGETISGIDYRPATGQLYGLASESGGTVAQLYRIDTTTGALTAVGGMFPLNAATVVGMDFDPVTDELRVISNVGINRRIDPDTGAGVFDNFADYAPGDPNEGSGNVPHALAYSNNFNGATSTTLYGITYANQVILVTVGSPNGTPVSPNSGQMFTVGGSGLTNYFNVQTGLDITSGGTAYAVLNSPVRLYTVNLGTGAITLVGNFPTNTIRDLAVGFAPAVASPGVPTLSGAMLAMLAVALGAIALVVIRR